MVHRSKVTFLWRDDEQSEVLSRIAESGYSRFPVCGEDIDDIVGILYAKTYLTAVSCGEAKGMDGFLLPVRFVHASTRINSILLDMQREHAHMVIVVDDFGGVIGVITLEDILEELVGEIWDESDEVIDEISKQPDGSYRILCSAELDTLQAALERGIDSEADTVSGWVIEKLGGIPEEGECFTDSGLHVTVTETDSRRVLEINVIIAEEDGI